MSTTGLTTFDSTLQKTNQWIQSLDDKLGWNDRHKTFQALRVTLHALRDRVPPEEAVELGAQLPILLSGFYYENWRIPQTPTKERTRDEFLGKIKPELQRVNVEEEPAEVVSKVFQTVTEQVTAGEAKDIVHSFPAELKSLWPEAVQA